MKCFAVFTALVTMAVADPILPLVANRAHLGVPYGYAAPALNPYLGLRGYAAPAAAIPSAHAAPVAAIPTAHAAPAAAIPTAHAAPAAAIPAAHAAPAVPAGPVASQYHSQDELGNYEYGYSNINSAKRERGNAYTGVEGEYSYVDAYGLPQKVNYVADGLGFRATGTNFPTTAATLGLNSAGLVLRHKRSVVGLPAVAPLGYAQSALGYAGLLPAQPAPLAAGYAAGPIVPGPYAAPTISAPAAREAILTRIQNNPGHAVSYRVD